MTYEFVSVTQESSDGAIVTFNRQFRPNWLQRLLGYVAKDEYVRYIGYDKHWWDLSYGLKVPRPIAEQCTLHYRRSKHVEGLARQVSDGRESVPEARGEHGGPLPLP